ncbi:MAG TPA: methyltransferase domain-containing protein [Polyangium sp.]|nr:methyltransferase domain-containing protein [Polyangium sp.]
MYGYIFAQFPGWTTHYDTNTHDLRLRVDSVCSRIDVWGGGCQRESDPMPRIVDPETLLSMTISLICPACRAELDESKTDRCTCIGCGRVYPIEDRVLRLLERTDEFYEGAYQNHLKFVPLSENLIHAWPLWLMHNGYLWAVRQYVPEGSVVVELGCAGGVAYFGKRYEMIGCDVSFSSLQHLPGYKRGLQADASGCIPLQDGSVDAVVSSYFWEHIPPNVKPAILRECQRILKPGGKIVFLYDVETENPFIDKYKKRDRRLYDKLFIEGDGHFGYERPRDNLETFESLGFRIVDHSGKEKTFVQSPAVFTKLAQFGGMSGQVFQRARGLGHKPWFYAYTALVRIVDEMVCPFLDESWARIDMVVAEK